MFGYKTLRDEAAERKKTEGGREKERKNNLSDKVKGGGKVSDSCREREEAKTKQLYRGER